MLAGAGLVEGTDYETVLARRLRPARPLRARRHRRVPRLQEQRAGPARAGRAAVRPVRPDRVRRPRLVRRDLHDPPVRRRAPDRRARTSCGRRCAASPTPSPTRTAATQTAIDLVEANGNPSFLSLEGETFRWATDAELLTRRDAGRHRHGRPRLELLQAEVDAYAEVGLFGGEAPDVAPFVDAAPIAGVYDDTGQVIWPGLTVHAVFARWRPAATLDDLADTRIGRSGRGISTRFTTPSPCLGRGRRSCSTHDRDQFAAPARDHPHRLRRRHRRHPGRDRPRLRRVPGRPRPRPSTATYVADLHDVERRAGDGAIVLVAEVDDQIVGTVTLLPERGRGRVRVAAGWAAIRALAVDPDAPRSRRGTRASSRRRSTGPRRPAHRSSGCTPPSS